MAPSAASSALSATLTSAAAAAAAATTTSATKAKPQGGILEGGNPTTYSASDPIILFIIQAGIIIIFTRLLHYPLSLLRQPRVIAEVIGGILLGPSVLMRVPNFKDTIFPKESMPVLSNVANIGLILFLFLIGLEVDMRMFTSNWRVALSVGLAGMVLPFALGCAISWGLYNDFHVASEGTSVSFGVYAVFIGTALSITAFPVLCRILSELKLLGTPVGITVLAAGVGNDVTGWILLALCVALVNNGSGITALWVLLVAVGWVLFLFFAVRPGVTLFLRRSGALQNGPSQGVVGIVLLLVLLSAWFTAIIGVHAIFGGFLIGLILPHHGGFAIKLTEKIEDLVASLFLPLYFALSGLNTNLGLLNDGLTWGYVIGVIAVAFAGKMIGGTLAARACKLFWRESLAIGALMSCKGLVELIVLNIGLQAGILSQRTFTMFVVMALVTTVATTPLTKALYPPWYQKKLEKWKRGEIDWDGNVLEPQVDPATERLEQGQIRRLLVQLRLDNLPSLFTFISLLGGATDKPTTVGVPPEQSAEHSPGSQPTPLGPARRPLEVHGLRLVELTERTSSVMQVTEGDVAHHDPVFNAFQTFSNLNDLAVSGHVAVVPTSSYAETLVSRASDVSSDFLLIPWSEHGHLTEDTSTATVISHDTTAADRFGNRTQSDFVQSALQEAACTTAIFISPTSSKPRRAALSRTVSSYSMRSHHQDITPAPALLPQADKSHKIFVPFIGGADDRAALLLVLQLARNVNVTVTAAHIRFPAEEEAGGAASPAATGGSSQQLPAAEGKAVEEEPSATDLQLWATAQAGLAEAQRGRVTFREAEAAGAGDVAALALALARETVGRSPRNAGDLVVVGRRHKGLAGLLRGDGDGFQAAVGVLAEKVALGDVKAGLLVVQAARDAPA